MSIAAKDAQARVRIGVGGDGRDEVRVRVLVPCCNRYCRRWFLSWSCRQDKCDIACGSVRRYQLLTKQRGSCITCSILPWDWNQGDSSPMLMIRIPPSSLLHYFNSQEWGSLASNNGVNSNRKWEAVVEPANLMFRPR
jgi:hypothetical protein